MASKRDQELGPGTPRVLGRLTTEDQPLTRNDLQQATQSRSVPVPGGTSAACLEDAAPDSPDASRAEEPRGRYLHDRGVSGSEPCPVLEGEASLAGLALTAGGSLVQHQPRLLAYSDGPRHLEKINLRNQSLAKRRRDRLHHPRLLTYIAITRRRRMIRLVLAGFCMPLVAFVLSLLHRYALLFFASRRQFPVLQNSFSALARSSYSNTLIPGLIVPIHITLTQPRLIWAPLP